MKTALVSSVWCNDSVLVMVRKGPSSQGEGYTMKHADDTMWESLQVNEAGKCGGR